MTLTCAGGTPWLEHFRGGCGCLWCAAAMDELGEQFARDVAEGRCDAAGFTAKERARQQAPRSRVHNSVDGGNLRTSCSPTGGRPSATNL